MEFELPTPSLEYVCDLKVELDHIREMGIGRAGQRRIIPIVGGKVTGPHINGCVLHVGADWQTVFKDGLAELDTRYAIETDDGATIEVLNYGYRHGPASVLQAIAKGETIDPREYYMRTHARLETGSEHYGWVNNTLFIGVGARQQQSVSLKFYAIR